MTLYRTGDINAMGFVSGGDGEPLYPVATEYLEAAVTSGALVPVDTELYEHDGEARTSNGEYVSASEALQNAIEWGMCRVGKGTG